MSWYSDITGKTVFVGLFHILVEAIRHREGVLAFAIVAVFL